MYESGEPETDERGNQYTPGLSLSTAEITAGLYDATGYHRQALAFAARDGKNTLSIRFDEGGAELLSVAIIPKDSTEDVKSNESGEDEASAFKVQAEYPLYFAAYRGLPVRAVKCIADDGDLGYEGLRCIQ